MWLKLKNFKFLQINKKREICSSYIINVTESCVYEQDLCVPISPLCYQVDKVRLWSVSVWIAEKMQNYVSHLEYKNTLWILLSIFLNISTSSSCAASLCIQTSSWLAHHTLQYLITILSRFWMKRQSHWFYSVENWRNWWHKFVQVFVPLSVSMSRRSIDTKYKMQNKKYLPFFNVISF